MIDSLISALQSKNFGTVISLLKQAEDDGVQAGIIADQLLLEIHTEALQYAGLLGLVDGLIDVKRSSLPSAKLLATLGIFSSHGAAETKLAEIPKPKPTAAAAVTLPKKLEIPELAIKATEKKPKDDLVVIPKIAPTPVIKKPTRNSKINWVGILDQVKDESIGLRTMLLKCDHSASDGVLTIYTRNEFYKKKLDTTRYKQILQTILDSSTGENWDIETIPSLKPSDNSHIANVAAIMGGGEEVSIEDSL